MNLDHKKRTTERMISFLRESNAIEDVWDDDSLQQAIYAWEYLMDQEKITISVVRKLHKILMFHQPLELSDIGYFRTVGVHIGGREGIKWTMLPGAMEVWCWNAWLYPENWKAHHIRYEIIHPFVDGNGRTGRMLMNWQRMKIKKPILVIKEKEKQTYYHWFD